MLILSWNVAGLSTTVNRIHEAYGDKNASSSSAHSSNNKSPSAALATYFSRHAADIICLQEHKIPKQQLSSRSEPRHASTVPGYESFWSCCVDDKKKGLNGVVTYAVQGSVRAADAAPLGSPDLDQQGRCVMTDHGSFVLFNVYVPASGGQSMSYKMKFLKALQRAMRRQREEKKVPVILVGDLNITHTARDMYWKDRVVYVARVLEQVQQYTNSGSGDGDHDQDEAGGSGVTTTTALPAWKLQLSRYWATIQAALETKQVVETQTTNSLTNEQYNKFRMAVTVDGNRRVWLGPHEVSRDYCEYRYNFDAWTYIDADTEQEIVGQEENTISVGILAELMSKIVGIQWDDKLLREIAETEATADHVSPTRKWLTLLLQEDDMVDGFRHFYPTAQARFTCWHQFTNKRYENDGIRLDYTIFDKCLLPQVAKGNVPSLRCCGDFTPEESLGEKAALVAATANGRFQPVSFEGGGISVVSQEALDTQFGPAHTGMVYTPPLFSDHIGVSLLLDDALLSNDLTLQEDDAKTRKAQPHKLQKSIASFFTPGAASATAKKSATTTAGKKGLSGTSSYSNSAKRFKTAKKPPVNSILHHFKKKE